MCAVLYLNQPQYSITACKPQIWSAAFPLALVVLEVRLGLRVTPRHKSAIFVSQANIGVGSFPEVFVPLQTIEKTRSIAAGLNFLYASRWPIGNWVLPVGEMFVEPET